jgi:hypothetical protein
MQGRLDEEHTIPTIDKARMIRGAAGEARHN